MEHFEWQIRQETEGVLDTVLYVPKSIENIYQQVISCWNNNAVVYTPLYDEDDGTNDSVVDEKGRMSKKNTVHRLLVPWQYYPEACRVLLQAPDKFKKLKKVRVLPRDMYMNILDKQDGGYEVSEAEWKEEKEKRWAFIPAAVKTKLYTFQKDTIELTWKRLGRMLIAHDMGLGKTLQAICVATGYRDEWPVLVICLASLNGTWKDAWKDWMNEDAVTFANGKDVPVQLKKRKNVYIISFDLLKRPEVSSVIAEHKFQCVIIDEIHLLQSKDSQRTKACKKLFQKKCKRVIALSGTPAERPSDLWPLLNIIRPELFPKWWTPLPRYIKTWDQARAFVPSEQYQTYALRYCDPQPEVFRDQVRWNLKGKSRLQEQADILRFFFYSRKTKAECAKDLPAKIRKKVMLQVKNAHHEEFLEEEMNKLIKLQQEKKEALLEKNKQNKKASENKESQRRMQLMHIWRSVLQQVKLPITLEYCREMFGENTGFRDSGEKIIIFAYHKDALTPICNLLKDDLKYEYIRIDGSVSHPKRHAECERFCKNPNVRFAVLSILAAGTGLNLQVASQVIFAELYWTAKHNMQAEDRAHRIGCKSDVLIKYLILEKSIETSIWKSINAKQTVQNTLFDTRSLVDRQNNIQSAFLPTFSAKPVHFVPSEEDKCVGPIQQFMMNQLQQDEKSNFFSVSSSSSSSSSYSSSSSFHAPNTYNTSENEDINTHESLYDEIADTLIGEEI
jgi:SNF2 family DNA or RNA helicase